jgi:hypothetical protein
MDFVFWKSVATTAVFVLALGNVLTILQVLGKHQLLPLSPMALSRWHRVQGDAALVIFFGVAYYCLTEATVDPHSRRVFAHVVLGWLTLLLVAAKVATSRWLPRLGRLLNPLGVALFLATAGTFATSALWYWLAEIWGIDIRY